jgi:Zn-finger nucleic acid-binding protein
LRCPKETNTELVPTQLADGLSVKCCNSCEGNWIALSDYQRWQALNAGLEAIPEEVVPLRLDNGFTPAPLDGKAGLCPECGTYLKRSRLNLKQASFYVERCPLCSGLWCDRGEWQVFEALGLHVQIPIVFTPEWQSRVRVLEQTERQRLAVIEKLGPDIANRVFELADLLKSHPQGDFGVAYLMRKFDS